MTRLSTDNCYRTQVTDAELAQLLYEFPQLDISGIHMADPEKYNTAVTNLYLDWAKLETDTAIAPDEFHAKNQRTWLMPEQYQNRELFGMLCYLKYLVDIAKENNVVLGVGRGSSVASFVLYVLGVHRIHSLRHNLDFAEFMR